MLKKSMQFSLLLVWLSVVMLAPPTAGLTSPTAGLAPPVAGLGDSLPVAALPQNAAPSQKPTDPDEQFMLGKKYYEGEGVAQDYAEAVQWYRQAAEQGNPAAQSNLGVMYVNGKEVRQNFVVAYMWLSLSAAAGDELAAKTRNSVAQHMTPEQVAEAERLAREWWENHKQQ